MHARRASVSRSLLGLLLLLALPAGCRPPDGGAAFPRRSADDLPVTRVVLYQNGIGYFERRGTIDSDHFTMRIRADQIADVLKSITVVDVADGRAVSVALPVEKSQARRLADLPPQVREQGGLLAVAAAFRGARAEVHAGGRSASGRIVGVEQIEVPPRRADQPPAQDWRLTMLVDGRTLMSFSFAEIRALKILDRTLTVGLEKALDVSLNEGTWKPIELTVHLAGRRPHKVVVSYVVEMPTWKPAYRVVLGDADQALLQSWAVVDNVSGEDWNRVALALTAGTPLAFTYDLYTPHYVRRPDLTPPAERMGAGPPPPPPPAVGAATAAPMADRAPAKPSRRQAGPGGAGRGRAPRAYDDDYSVAEEAPYDEPVEYEEVDEADLERNYRALVEGAGVGSLFRYDLQEAITLADRSSALVSIVSERVPGSDGLLFRAGVDARNPYRVARLKNETGFLLEGGPVAIYRQATFLGEALVARMEKGASVFVPYALDTRVDVFLDEERREESMRLVSIVNGRLVAESKSVTRYVYDVDNRAGEPAVLWVMRARRTGWKITRVGLADGETGAPPQPGRDGVLEEKSVYYVPIALPATGHVKFVVEEETPGRREVEIVSAAGRDIIAAYVSSPDADREVVRKLREIQEIGDKLATVERSLAELGEKRRLLGERETQVRDNLNLLRKTPENADLRRQMADRLADLEKQLDEVTRTFVTLGEERARLREGYAAAVKNLKL